MGYFFFSIVNLYAFFEGFGVILCSNSLMRQVTHSEYVKNAKSQIRWEINIHSIVAFFFLSVGAVNARVLDLVVWLYFNMVPNVENIFCPIFLNACITSTPHKI